MPGARIIEILDEIGRLTQNPHIHELATELGELLANDIYTTRGSITKLRERTTSAIVDTEATLEDHIIDLRTAVQGLTQLFRKRMTDVEDRNETITGRVHTLANHMMAVEQKVSELAEAVTLLLDQMADNNENDDSYNTDDRSLDNPYDGNERS